MAPSAAPLTHHFLELVPARHRPVLGEYDQVKTGWSIAGGDECCRQSPRCVRFLAFDFSCVSLPLQYFYDAAQEHFLLIKDNMYRILPLGASRPSQRKF
jgi:hypothetical protein